MINCNYVLTGTEESLFVSTKSTIFKAFTLAEILVTLGIIGVVAALTIPILVKNYQKNQAATQLKDVYSIIYQATTTSIQENGEPSTWDWGTAYTNASTTLMAETYVLPYIKITKNCGYTATGECKATTPKLLDGTSFNVTGYQIILSNGAFLSFLDETSQLSIFIDLNGNSSPNVFGRDVFLMAIMKSQNNNNPRFHGLGTNRNTLLNDTTYGCNKTASSRAGIFCGALIQADNWQIADDYPW